VVIVGVLAGLFQDAIKPAFNYVFSSSSEKPIFTKNDENFKILILPFNQLCEYNGNSYDAGEVINLRLQKIAKEQKLNIESWWDTNYNSSLLANDTENEVKRLEKLHHTDMIVFGIVEACDASENQVCVNFHTNKKYKLGNTGSNLNNEFKIGTITDVKLGKLQEDVENIAILISVLSQVNEIDHTEYLQKLKSLIERKNLGSLSKEFVLDVISDQLENTGNSTAALKYYNELLNDFKEDKYNYGVTLSRIGNINAAKGNLDKALKCHKKEVELFKELYKQDPSNCNFKNGLAIGLEKLGEINEAKGNLDEALKYYREYYRLTKELYEQHKDNVNLKNGLAISYSKLGNINKVKGNLDEALKHYKERYRLTKELFEQDPSNVNYKNGLAISYEKLGEINKAKGNLDEAFEHYNEQTKLFEELYEQDKSNVNFKNGLAISYSKLGNIYIAKGKLIDAYKNYEERYRLCKSLYERDPSNIKFKNGLAISYIKLGNVAVAQKNRAKAIDYFKKAEQHLLVINTNTHDYVEFSRNLVEVQRALKALEQSSSHPHFN